MLSSYYSPVFLSLFCVSVCVFLSFKFVFQTKKLHAFMLLEKTEADKWEVEWRKTPTNDDGGDNLSWGAHEKNHKWFGVKKCSNRSGQSSVVFQCALSW